MLNRHTKFDWLHEHIRERESLSMDAGAWALAVVEAPTGITFVGYENPPGITTEDRVRHFLDSDRAAWYNHVNIAAHEWGGHFIPWEIPDQWIDDLRRTFRGRR